MINQKSKIKSQKYNSKIKTILILFVVGVTLVSVFCFPFFVSKVNAATGINRQINFQGKLVDGNGLNVADSTYTVRFRLYTDSSADGANSCSNNSCIWEETDSVTTKAGIFQVALGANTSLPDNVYFNQNNLYLGIKVSTDSEMTPRIRFTAVPYAINSASLDGVVATQSATGFTMQGGTSSQSTLSFSNNGTALTFQPGVSEGLTLDTNGANGLSMGASANAITFGGTNNPTYEFKGTGGVTFDETTLSLANSSSSTIQTTGTDTGLTLLSKGAGNITLGQNAGNGNILIAPNAGGQAALIVKDQGTGDLFTASAGATTKFTIGNNGVITLSGGEYLDDNTAADTLILGSNGTNGGVVRVPVTNSGTTLESSVGSAGDIYYDSTKSLFRCYQGTGWQNCIPAVNFQSTQGSNTITLTASEQSLLSGSIIPSATTSKIWINFTGTVNGDSNTGRSVTIRIRRGSCTTGTQVGVDQVVSTPMNGGGFTAAVNYVDTPGVTTSTTYNVCALTSAGSPTVTGRGMTLYEPTGSAATAGLGSLTVQNSDTSNSVTGVSTLQFGAATSPTDTFTVTDQTGGVARVQLGSQVGLLNQAETATSVWNFSNGLGVGTGSPLAALDVRGNTATTPIASLSGSTTFAGLVIDNSGTGDLLTASQGGVPHFTVQHNGTIVDSTYTTNGGLLYSTSNGTFTQLADVANGSCLTSAGATSVPTWISCSGLGTNLWQLNGPVLSPGNLTTDLTLGGTSTVSAKIAFTNINSGTPIASIAAQSGTNTALVLGADSSIQSVRRQTLTLGGNTTGDITFSPGGTANALYLSTSGNVGIGTTVPGAALDVSGSLLLAGGGTIDARATGGLTIGGGTNTNSLTLGKSGASISLPNYNGCGLLITSGTTLTCSSLPPGSTNYWQLNNTVIAPGNTTFDMLLGGTSTTSAKFAFTGNAGTATPVASISANPSNGNASGLSLSGSGTIQSLNSQTLTLGGSTTGNIVIDSGSNVTQLADNALQLTGTAPVISSTNTLTINAFTLGGDITAGSHNITGLGTASFGSGNLSLTGNTITSGTTLTLSGATTLSDSGLATLTTASGLSLGSTTSLTLGGTATAIGGTAAGSSLTLESTSGAGNGDFVAFKTGSQSERMRIDTKGNIGINTTSPLATLDVRGTSATTPAASVEATTNFASMVVNNSGSGDIFTASKSGATKFVVTNSGNVGIGNAIPTRTLDFSGTLGGNSLVDNQSNCNTTVTETTKALAYFLSNTVSNATVTCTFNITGVPNTEGTVVFISGRATGSASKTANTAIQINGVSVLTANITSASTTTVFKNFLMAYMNGGWRVMGTAASADTADLAEWIKTTGRLPQKGELVSIGDNTTMHISDGAYDNKVAGIVSTNPNTIYGTQTDDSIPMALSGRVPAIVTSLGGNIQAGDSIVASPLSGAGMLPQKPGQAVGKALESFIPNQNACIPVSSFDAITWPGDDGTNQNHPCFAVPVSSFDLSTQAMLRSQYGVTDTVYVGKVMVLVNLSPVFPATDVNAAVPSDGNYDLLKNADLSLFDATPSATASGSGVLQTYYTIQTGAGIAVDSTTAFAKATIGNIQAGAVVAKEISTDQLKVTTGNIMLGSQTLHDYIAQVVQEVIAQNAQKNPQVTITSVDGLTTISANAQAVQQFTSEQQAIASQSSQLVIDTDKLDKGLIVLNDASKVLAAATASAQTTTALQITTTPAASDSSDLGIAGLTVAGKATISGDIRVKGDGLIEGILHVADTLFANNVVVNGISEFFGNVIFHNDVTFEGRPTVNSDTAGFAIVKKGTDHVDVKFAKAYDQVPVINASLSMTSLTPTPSETADALQKRQSELEKSLLAANIHFIITNKTTTGFTILLDKPADEDVAFEWLALSVHNPVIFQSNQQTQSPTPASSPSPIESIIPTEIPTVSSSP